MRSVCKPSYKHSIMRILGPPLLPFNMPVFSELMTLEAYQARWVFLNIPARASLIVCSVGAIRGYTFLML
jgi:hypothetical protein